MIKKCMRLVVACVGFLVGMARGACDFPTQPSKQRNIQITVEGQMLAELPVVENSLDQLEVASFPQITLSEDSANGEMHERTVFWCLHETSMERLKDSMQNSYRKLMGQVTDARVEAALAGIKVDEAKEEAEKAERTHAQELLAQKEDCERRVQKLLRDALLLQIQSHSRLHKKQREARLLLAEKQSEVEQLSKRCIQYEQERECELEERRVQERCVARDLEGDDTHLQFKVDDVVIAYLPVQQYSLVTAKPDGSCGQEDFFSVSNGALEVFQKSLVTTHSKLVDMVVEAKRETAQAKEELWTATRKGEIRAELHRHAFFETYKELKEREQSLQEKEQEITVLCEKESAYVLDRAKRIIDAALRKRAFRKSRERARQKQAQLEQLLERFQAREREEQDNWLMVHDGN